MKISKFCLLLFVLCVSSGCATFNKINLPVQEIFTKTFPPTFKGDATVAHKNAWFDITITVKDLHRVGETWVYSNLSYKRNDRFSSGEIIVNGKTE